MGRTKHLFTILVLAVLVVWGALFSLPDQKLHLIFCDVGQGDAILITKGTSQILVDGGPSDKVLGCLSKHMPFWDHSLEIVVSTHPEYDHLTGLISVIERYSVKQLISNSLLTETGVFSNFRQEVIEKKIPVYSPKNGDKIKIASLELRVLFPKEKLGEEVVWKKSESSQVLGLTTFMGNFNETAIVSELVYGDFRALLTADIGVGQEKEIETGLGRVDILKVAHHGSKYSTSEEFLKEVAPALAVISVGVNNRYGHPTSEVLDRLRNSGIKILRTDIDGEVEIVSDGENWQVIN